MTLDRPRAEDPYAKLPELPSFALSSTDFSDGQPLPSSAVADGGDTSPALTWSGTPDGTKSFVVSCFDPDAPTPSGFWHWVAVDLPADTTSLPAGAGGSDESLPGKAFHLRNDAGTSSYAGAAPPPGDEPHRYYYVVHAVGEEALGVEPDASPAMASFQLAFKALARAVVVGTHQA